MQRNEIPQVLRNLLASTRALLASHPSAAVSSFLRLWPQADRLQETEPSSLPVLRCLNEELADPAPFAAQLCASLRRAAPFLAWRQTYTAAEADPDFLKNYGWTEIVGPKGILASGEIACGFLVLGRNTLYPSHRHEAEELYVPLAGAAAWQKGAGLWKQWPPGTLIEHAGGEPHAILTTGRPLLALYGWHGRISQSARLDRPSGGTPASG